MTHLLDTSALLAHFAAIPTSYLKQEVLPAK
jgi:hypothetical protein